MTQASLYVEIRQSALSGSGAFARTSIAKETIVMPMTGSIVRRADLGEDSYDRAIVQVEDDLFLEATGEPDDYINHCCTPNLAFTQDGGAFYALRDIAAGEELTYDYATSEDDGDWKVECACGAAQCRGVITGFPALSLTDQLRLYPLCRPYLKRKYENILRKSA